MITKIEVKPLHTCPKCGNTNFGITRVGGMGNEVWIYCPECLLFYERVENERVE